MWGSGEPGVLVPIVADNLYHPDLFHLFSFLRKSGFYWNVLKLMCGVGGRGRQEFSLRWGLGCGIRMTSRYFLHRTN